LAGVTVPQGQEAKYSSKLSTEISVNIGRQALASYDLRYECAYNQVSRELQ